MEKKKSIHEMIFERRRFLNLSRTELGKKIFPNMTDLSAQSKIKRFERDQVPKAHELEGLADALGLDTETLIHGLNFDDDANITLTDAFLKRFPDLKDVLRICQDLANIKQYDSMETVFSDWFEKWHRRREEIGAKKRTA